MPINAKILILEFRLHRLALKRENDERWNTLEAQEKIEN